MPFSKEWPFVGIHRCGRSLMAEREQRYIQDPLFWGAGSVAATIFMSMVLVALKRARAAAGRASGIPLKVLAAD
jgi:hypothetical protein